MIWLGSFPRSGNTFFRNVLFEVYGLSSSSFYENVGEPENYTEFPFVKTHLLPEELVPSSEDIKSVYLVRDGRDALVSMVHQQIDIYGSTKDFREIFIEALIAAEGSYFGGWSRNVEEWLKRADVLIRFEDLIQNPIIEIEKVRKLMELPDGDTSKLPSFKDLKFGQPKYGRGKRVAKSENEQLDIIKKSFRKGKAFGWKDELDQELQDLYWSYHRNTMDKLGYDKDGFIRELNPDFDYELMSLMGQNIPTTGRKYTVLIEANKLLMHHNDGIKRYLLELLKALYPVSKNERGKWQIDVLLRGKIVPLREYGESLFDADKNENHEEEEVETVEKISAKDIIKWPYTFAKKLIPIPVKDEVKSIYRQILMKIGLKYSGNKGVIGKIKNLLSLKKANEEMKGDDLNTLSIDEYDLVHVPLPQHYEPFKGTSANLLVTIHDMTHQLFSEYHTKANVDRAETGIKYFEKQDSSYICISKTTREDFKRLYGIREDKMYTVYEATDTQKFRPRIVEEIDSERREAYNIPDKPFLFALSTLEPRKNIVNTIKAFDMLLDENPELDVNMVIGGKNGWKSKDLMQFRHQENIIFTGFVNENDLPGLYSEAEALCYVSYYEGFGLPPLEAMSCGTPVIFGDNSSMKELFEGYALPANPDSIEDIKNQMKSVLTDKDFKKKIGRKGLQRSFDFSWRKTVEETLGVYEDCIRKKQDI